MIWVCIQQLYEKTLTISSYKTISNSPTIDLSSPVGTTYTLGSSTVTIIDPFATYLDTLKECFDFNQLKEFGKREGFTMLFDGMHGAGGIFARRVLVDELGLPEVCFNKVVACKRNSNLFTL
jgi:phosphoglucomutase